MTRTAIRIVPLMLVALWLAPPGRAAAPCTVPGSHPTIQAAVDDPTCDPINVGSGTFHEDLFIDRSVRVVGAGTGTTIVDGLGGTSTIRVSDGDAYTLTFEALTITGGGGGGGGGISAPNAAHTLTLSDVSVSGNEAGTYAGIFLEAADLNMTSGSISDNHSSGDVGGVGLQSGDATFTGVRIEGNTAVGNAGGVSTSGGTTEFRGGSIDGNEAGGDGGGIYASDSLLTVLDSSVTNNMANSFGGILSTADAIVSLTNVTVSGNRVPGNGGGMGTTNSGDITGTNVTVAANTADTDNEGGGVGGGIFRLVTDGGPITLKNSIVAGNTDGSPPAATDCSGDITSNGHNILGSTTGCEWSAGPSDQLNVDPMLAPLADNGGGTLTHALLAGSPAIDAADPAAAPPNDQRGLARSDPDIGAYELVLCKKVAVNLIGTEGNDTLTGGNESNGALAGGGNDRVNTGGGTDAVCAGAGKDKVNGGGGKDRLFGEAGKDKLKGGGGKDRLNGGAGKDRCNGGAGKDKGTCEKERKI